MIDPQIQESRLHHALASLNRIGTTINRMKPQDFDNIAMTLRQIVESAIQVVPGTSAVIYNYNREEGAFDMASRVSAGEKVDPVPGDVPRPDGMGMHAIKMRRRVLSYEVGAPEIHPIKVDAGARVVACFPLIVAEEILGALYVYLHEDRLFDELELLLLENFVNQAAMATFHARQVSRIQRDLARREDEVIRLRRAGLLISSRAHLKETMDAILEMALEVTDAQYGNFLLVDTTGKELKILSVAGEQLSRPITTNIPIDSMGVTAWVARNRQAVCITDLKEEPWASIYLTFDHDLEMRSELAVPLISASGRLEGVLNLESPQPNAFAEQDNHLLQALATQAVIAIQEVRIMNALKEVTELLLSRSQREVLQRLAGLASELLNAAASAIWVLKDNTLVLEASSGEFTGDERAPLEYSLIGAAVVSRSPVISEDVRTDPRFHRPDLAQARGWARALVVPLPTGDDHSLAGALSVFGLETEPGHFAESEWDKKVLTILADYAALAMLNNARQAALQEAREQRSVAETFAALGDAAANLLHQMNNRIGVIPVRVQGMQDKSQEALRSDSYLATNLAQIEQDAREAMSIVRDNLELLRPISLGRVDIAACVSQAIAAARLPSGVHVEVEGLRDLPLVIAASQSLALVFVNLLENAANAMRGDGTVSIRGMLKEDLVRIDIRDNGPGISPQLVGQIFEFNFSGGDLSGHTGKLGFGLWWIKTLMMRLGGSITVDSDGEHGTTFQLRLPLQQDDHERNEEIAHRESG